LLIVCFLPLISAIVPPHTAVCKKQVQLTYSSSDISLLCQSLVTTPDLSVHWVGLN